MHRSAGGRHQGSGAGAAEVWLHGGRAPGCRGMVAPERFQCKNTCAAWPFESKAGGGGTCSNAGKACTGVCHLAMQDMQYVWVPDSCSSAQRFS